MTSRAENKANRLLQIEALLLTHPEGLSQAEIARRLDVNRSTINRYIPDLPGHVYIDDMDGGKWKIDREAYLVRVRLSLHEALAVHLASRLLATRMDRQNPHAAAALRKLSIALERLAPMISRHLADSADVMDDQAQRHDPRFLQVLEKLTLAWAEGRKLHIWHRSTRTRKVHEYLFSPYFIEPYAVGQSIHTIGFSEPPNALRTYRIDRIERIEETRVRYVIPEDFDPREQLADAWGIWYTDAEPVEVVLRFNPGVSDRVRETRWHRSEEIEEQPDGYLIWRARVAEPREMLPWIRGWGADCKVLEPGSLRHTLEQEARRLTQLYKISSPSLETKTQYYAHSKINVPESEWQLLKDHLVATGDLAAALGDSAGISELARISGLLHDIGKYSQEFQARLRGDQNRVDHSTAGAREVVKLFADDKNKTLAEIVSYCIAGHHTGLLDYGSMADTASDGSLLARREKKKLTAYSAYQSEIDVSKLRMPLLSIKPAIFRLNNKEEQFLAFSVSFLTRMLFSTLVDADWLETERYMDEREKPRGQFASIEVLTKEFNSYLKRFENPQTPINRRRTETLKACIEKANLKPGFFTLTVPTGGGKTIASMAFALNHACLNELERIIYVIPFTSIIEQNAEVFRRALGDLGAENVLEHHSNYDWEGKRKTSDDETNMVQEKLRLAAENWDIPIIVTTNVQFFESLYASKKSRARKVHNMAKSVIIFDEVQMLPRHYLKPSLLAIQELVNNYGCSAVFCTATQPSLEKFFPSNIQFTELTTNPKELYDFYRRVEVKNLNVLTDEELLKKLNAHEQVLCIVNTRRHAKGLYDQLESGGSFHLSTLMCPAHREQTLKEIRQSLKNGQPCRVISTQVMEAGIDVDFPVGYRSLAGLDSIIQAAGRVNREMKKNKSEMFVFNPKTEYIKRTPIFIMQTAAVAENILRSYAADPTAIEAIEAYYQMLYKLQDEQFYDAIGVMSFFEKGTDKPDFDFKTAAEKFKFIDQNTVPIIIPFDENATLLISELQYVLYPGRILRQLQTYTVNVYEMEFEKLQSLGVIHTVSDLYNVLDKDQMEKYYHPKTGLVLPETSSGEAIFFD